LPEPDIVQSQGRHLRRRPDSPISPQSELEFWENLCKAFDRFTELQKFRIQKYGQDVAEEYLVHHTPLEHRKRWQKYMEATDAGYWTTDSESESEAGTEDAGSRYKREPNAVLPANVPKRRYRELDEAPEAVPPNRKKRRLDGVMEEDKTEEGTKVIPPQTNSCAQPIQTSHNESLLSVQRQPKVRKRGPPKVRKKGPAKSDAQVKMNWIDHTAKVLIQGEVFLVRRSRRLIKKALLSGSSNKEQKRS
jgi:hypothetical protein